MVALPDWQLYYTEQHEEWVREEYDMPEYGKGEENVTWRCSRENCDALLATRTLAGPWHIWRNTGRAERVIALEKGEVQVQCPACGTLNEWQWAWSPKKETMPSYAVKRDANHGPIKRAAQSFGVFVIDLWQCAQFVPGLLDMLWVLPWTPTPAVLFIEVKDGHGKKLTPAEHKFINELRNAGALCYVLHSLEEAIKLLEGLRRGV